MALAVAMPQLAAAQPIEEVVVTARKREETLQKVPIAVSAMSGDQMEKSGIQTVSDLDNFVPSLNVVLSIKGSTSVGYAMRGQASNEDILASDQAVGIYVDGVNIPRARGSRLGFFDLERVEVLKGPQGTLYGRNTTGGAISYITKGADYSGYHGFASAEVGDYADKKLSLAVNVPLLDDKAAMRLAYQYWGRDGYGKSRITGQDLGDDHNDHFFRGSLRFDPTDKVKVVLKGEWARARVHGALSVPFFYENTPAAQLGQLEAAAEMGLITPTQALFGAGGVRPPAVLAAMAQAGAIIQGIIDRGLADPYTSDTSQWMSERLNSYLLGGTVTWDLSDNVQLKSITGYKDYNASATYDFEGTRFHMLDIGVGGAFGIPQTSLGVSNAFPIPRNVPDQDDHSFTQEFNLSGVAVDSRLNWLVGVYYSTEKGREYSTSAGLPIISGTVAVNDADVGEKSYSIYSQDDFKITDKLSVTVGGRWTKEVHSITWRDNTFRPTNGTISCKTSAYSSPAFTPTTPAGITDSNFCAESRKDTFKGVSWLGSLNYQVQDDVLVYLKASRGFRGGAEQQRTPAAPPVKPEFAQDIEVGLKADWFDHRLRTNLDYYHTKYKNKQETQFLPNPVVGGPVIVLLNNAAQATIQGVEAEVTANPFQGFTLRGQTAYFTGRYDSYPGAVSHITGPPVDASGEKFSYPSWSGSISARYEFPLFMGKFGAQADYSYTGRTHTSTRLLNPRIPASIAAQILPGKSGASFINGNATFKMVNLHFDYDMPDQGLTLSADITNAFDKTYRVYSIHGDLSGGVVNSFIYPPRMWTVTLTKKFGGE